MERRTGSFKALDETGEAHTVLIFTDFVDASTERVRIHFGLSLE